MKRLFYLILVCLGISMSAHAQMKSANKLYGQLKFDKAIPYYLKVVDGKKQDDKSEAFVKLADCYRLTHNIQKAAIWYEKALPYSELNAEFHLNYGNVLRTLGEYSSAKQQYKKHLNIKPNDIRAQIYSKYCSQIKNWESLEPSAKIENVESLNSVYSDFSPVVYNNGVVFISDRKVDEIDNNNYFWTGNGYLNLYYSEMDLNEEYLPPQIMSKKFNKSYHDGPACFSSDEKFVFITRTDRSKRYKKDSIQTHYSFIAKIDLEVPKSHEIDFPYNSMEYSVGHVALSKDGNILIFASNKPGGQGESDLYYCELEDEKWSSPLSLGKSINTFGNEYFPYLLNDSVLYFASDGHMGFGGLDIFVSELKDGEWQPPVNLKAPINSSFDDFSILVTGSESGFFSSNRPGGKGLDDIYRFRSRIGNKKQDD